MARFENTEGIRTTIREQGGEVLTPNVGNFSRDENALGLRWKAVKRRANTAVGSTRVQNLSYSPSESNTKSNMPRYNSSNRRHTRVLLFSRARPTNSDTCRTRNTTAFFIEIYSNALRYIANFGGLPNHGGWQKLARLGLGLGLGFRIRVRV